jgi:hypothetical protein
VPRRIVIVAMGAAIAILPASARAAPSRAEIGAFRTPAFADGERYAVAQLGDGRTTRIIDTRRHHTFEIRPRLGYSLVGTGGGAVLFTCYACHQPPDHAASTLSLVYDIARRRFVVPGAVNRATDEAAADGYSLEPRAIGRHWVSATEYGYKSMRPIWVNWRGEHPTVPEAGPQNTEDLDARKLRRRLCAPLTRGPWINPDTAIEDHQKWVAYAFERPFGLWNDRDLGLRLERCGHGGSERLGVVTRGGPQLGAGLASWGDSSHVRVQELRTGNRFAWHVGPDNDVLLQHTRTRAFFSRFVAPEDGQPGWQVSRARIPRSR